MQSNCDFFRLHAKDVAPSTSGRTSVYRAPGTQATGSGLSIVRRILELHRGRMQFDASPTGSGLQVIVALPRVREARV
jgi:signal transduction histidine kinase